MTRRNSPDQWDVPEIVEWREEDARLTHDRCLPLGALLVGVVAFCRPRRFCWPRNACNPSGCSPSFVCWPGNNCWPRPCLPR